MAGDPVKREQESEATQAVPSGATKRSADSDMSVYEILNWFYDPRQKTQDGNSGTELYGHARDAMGLTYELAMVEYAVGMKIRSDEDRTPSLYEMRAIAKFILGGKSDYGKAKAPREEHEGPGEEEPSEEKKADGKGEGGRTDSGDDWKKKYEEEKKKREEKDNELITYQNDMAAKEKKYQDNETAFKKELEDERKKKGKPPEKPEAAAIKTEEMEKKHRKELDKVAAQLTAQQKALKDAQAEINDYKKREAKSKKDLEEKEKKIKTYERDMDEVRERLKKLSGDEKAKEPGKEPEKKEAEPEKAEEKADEEKFADATVKYGKLAHQIETKYKDRNDPEAVLAKNYLDILDDLRAKENYDAVIKGVDGFDAYLNDAMEKRAKEAEKTKTTKALKEPESMLADIQREEREPVKLKDYTDTELFKASGMTLDEFNAYLQAQGLSGYTDVTHVDSDGTFYRPQDEGTREYIEDLLSGKIKMPEPVSEEEPLEKKETEKIAISEKPIEVDHDYTGSAKTETVDEGGRYGEEPRQYEEYPVLPEAEEAEAAEVAPAEPAKPKPTYEDIVVAAVKGGEPKGPEEGERKRGSDTEVPSNIGTPATPTSGLAPSSKIPPKAEKAKKKTGLIGDSVLPRKSALKAGTTATGAEPEVKKGPDAQVDARRELMMAEVERDRLELEMAMKAKDQLHDQEMEEQRKQDAHDLELLKLGTISKEELEQRRAKREKEARSSGTPVIIVGGRTEYFEDEKNMDNASVEERKKHMMDIVERDRQEIEMAMKAKEQLHREKMERQKHDNEQDIRVIKETQRQEEQPDEKKDDDEGGMAGGFKKAMRKKKK